MTRYASPFLSPRQTSQLRGVELEGRQLTYTLSYKRVKNVNLRIGSGGVQLSAPFQVSPEECDRLVLSRWSWIQRAIEQRQRLRSQDSPLSIPGQMSYLGKNITVRYGTAFGNTSDALLHPTDSGSEAAALEIRLTPSDSRLSEEERLQLAERLIEQWKMTECRRIMDPVCASYFSIFEPLGCRMPQIRYRRMKSQWGSYNRRTHAVTLNTRLLAYPMSCVEYVVLHELTHMLYPDHQQGFHRFMSSVMPDYRERRALLRSDG